MNVGIDISSLIYDRGVSRYTSNLVSALQKVKNTQLCLYGSSLRQHQLLSKKAQALMANASNTKLHLEHYPPQALALLWRLGLHPVSKHFSPSLDVFHSWDWMQPPDKQLPLVSTIHDLALLRYPETAHPTIVAAHKRSWEVLRKRNAQIIAVSRTTKKDIIELLGVPPENVHVVLEALPEETRLVSAALTEAQTEAVINRYNLQHKPYLLFVGTREPRKNLATLIEAWQPLAKEVRLLVVGAEGWEAEHAKNTTEKVQPEFLGKVSDRTLSVLYAEAAVFVYPSLYEGFGLPILEAFHHGTPVVTSNTASMPEVAGNAAELINPHSAAELQAAIEKILNETLPEQQKRLQKMIIRLHMFDWKKTAEETRAVYQLAKEKWA